MHSVLGWIVLGFLAGWVGSVLMGESRGCVMNIVIGIVGALLGGFLFNLAGHTPVTGLNLWSFFVALVGSILLLAFFRAIRGPQVA